MVKLTRRQFTVLPAAVLATAGTKASLPARAQPASPVITRAIPATGEPLPPVGLGTAEVFDVADTSTLQKAGAVVRALIGNGGKLIDTASTYGDAERILGDVIGPAALRGWKAQGVCRYIGITSTSHGAFATVEAILGREKPDFVQIDYSIDDREV